MAGTESELYKDKIEVSLDGRQIFYLFFGGAVVACLAFVLGVVVGRRLEARGHVDRVAATSTARDPLAALDRLRPGGDGAMTFPSALGGSGGPAAAVDREIAALGARRAAAPEAARPADKPVAKPAEEPGPAADKPADKPAADKPVDRPADKPAADKPADRPADKPAADKPADKPGPAKFTLQLSAFQDQAEADSFLATVKAAGYPAYVTSADVDGKKFFRVRVGSYSTYDDAVAAKLEFEKKVPKIAYVIRL